MRELIPPEGIVPMSVSESQAEELIKKTAKDWDKRLARIRVTSLKGVYLPAWTFDLGGQIKWTGYMEYQENKPVPVRDSRSIHFDDLFVPASKPEPKFFGEMLLELKAGDVTAFNQNIWQTGWQRATDPDGGCGSECKIVGIQAGPAEGIREIHI